MPQFNVPAPEDDFAEIRLKEERRREREKARDGGVARDLGEEPPEFDAAEFKKRELVFQPKKKTNSLARPAQKTQITQAAAHKRVLKIEGTMKLGDVASSIGVKAAEMTKVLMKNGIMATPATSLDFETLALILPDFGWEVQNVLKSPEELIEEMAFGNLDAEPIVRAPVVTIMGHVDHGKTSLLDAIRKANVAQGEAGGITQHIGAYQVELEDGYRITFLDTPGHEAFSAMRARGANVTDIAIIVVAADDGMMPQTAEAISHAKAAGVPIIVAVNKMDKPGANPDRVMQQLTELQIVPEEWGGETIYCRVSALTKQGIPELLEQIRLIAEVSELKANPERSGTGIVIEAKLDKGRGPVATLLIKDGSVSVGQWIVAGTQKGRVRSLMDDKGERIDRAGPGQPVVLLGLDGVPAPGDRFDVVKDESVVDRVVELRTMIMEQQRSASKKASLEEIFSKVKAGDVKELAVVLKADVHGSLEALLGMMQKLGNEEVKLKVVHSAVGGITESDVLLASTAKGIIIGFNVRPDNKAAQLAKNNGIEIRTYSIVYELMDDLKKALVGMLSPTIVESVLGRAEVRNTFTVPKVGTIAGCFVQDGKVARGSMLRLIRNGKIVFEGKLSSLKRFKDDVKEVASGYECGIGIENFNDIKAGDIIEAYTKESIERELASNAGAQNASV
jgi:translation initiation factor IF-2